MDAGQASGSPCIRAVIFDLDGTLIDSEPLYERVDQEFLFSKGILEPDKDWSTVVGMGGRAFVSWIKDEYDLPGEVDALVAEKDELYLSRATEVTVFPPVLELVRYLYVHDFRLAIATSSRRVVLEAMLSRTGLAQYFDATFSADDVRRSKPDPEIFLSAAARLGVSAEQCVVCEDSRYGVEAARRAGMSVVALPGEGQNLDTYNAAQVVVPGGAGRLDPQVVIDTFNLVPDIPDLNKLPDKVVKRFQTVVWSHARAHPRPMPWRETRDPYRILVSEFMLQQTQVARVVPRYEAFLARFPSVHDLAQASVSQVLALWQGLGYNRRGKYLLEAARKIVERHDGRVPESLDELTALPGVGAYTAAAVLSFAFSAPVAVVETNIRRVVIQYFFPLQTRVTEASVSEVVRQVLETNDPRGWYYAFMDYGAYLSRVLPNANRRSAAYVRQSRFEGSVRQVRGQIVRALTGEGPLGVRELERRIGPTDERFEKAIESLKADTMLIEEDGRLRLP